MKKAFRKKSSLRWVGGEGTFLDVKVKSQIIPNEALAETLRDLGFQVHYNPVDHIWVNFPNLGLPELKSLQDLENFQLRIKGVVDQLKVLEATNFNVEIKITD